VLARYPEDTRTAGLVVGLLVLHTEALAFPGDSDQTLFTFLADPGSPTGEALTVLSSWMARGLR